MDPATRRALLWWALGLALVVLAWLQFITHYFQAQARYFHPALLPMALAFALGWRRMLPGPRMRLAVTVGFAAVLIALTVWNAFGWRTLT